MQNSIGRLVCRQLWGSKSKNNNIISASVSVCSSRSLVAGRPSSRLFHLSVKSLSEDPSSPEAKESPKGPAKRVKTPIGKLDELEVGQHPYQEKEPLPAWPDNTNPHTGEVGGPRGPEPTRYGDWERKGRVTDF